MHSSSCGCPVDVKMPPFTLLVTGVSVTWLSSYCHDYIQLPSCWSHFTRTAGEAQHQMYIANDTQLGRTDERDRSWQTTEQTLGQVWWFGRSRGVTLQKMTVEGFYLLLSHG